MTKEAKARIKINKLLEDSGWRFFDAPQGRANIQLEAGTPLTEQVINDLGEDFEKLHSTGKCNARGKNLIRRFEVKTLPWSVI